jgi:hypothetical protein
MFHLELFTSTLAISGANNFQQLNYLRQDNILPPLNNGVQISPMLTNLMFVAGVGVGLAHIRPQTPSMLPFPYPTFSPNNRGSAFESPPRVWDLSSHPLAMKATDEFDIFATFNAAPPQTPVVGCLFTDAKPVPPPAGRYFTSHWTATTTLTANSWSLVQPIFDQPLPAGFYALLGARVYSPNALFFRLFPAMEPLWRPGAIAVQNYDQFDADGQRGWDYLSGAFAPWGVWMSFYQNVPPQCEIYSTGADTIQEGWFDLVLVNSTTSFGIA